MLLCTVAGGLGLGGTLDTDVRRLPAGGFYNTRLQAPNVWELEMDVALVDEARRVALDGSPFARLLSPGAAYERVATPSGLGFFAHRVRQWDSNIAWVSCDDAAAFAHFSDLFDRMGVARAFAPVVPHRRRLRMYNAFFVTRSWCRTPDLHVDYAPAVGTHALTLITPVDDFSVSSSFQLSYRQSGGGGMQTGEQPRPGGAVGCESASTAGDATAAVDTLARYEYRKGRAIVFGSGFTHATEAGTAAPGEQHTYLCFTFGTDIMSAWPDICSTIDSQSRLLCTPNGELQLSRFGRDLASLEEARRSGVVAEEEYAQLYREGLY